MNIKYFVLAGSWFQCSEWTKLNRKHPWNVFYVEMIEDIEGKDLTDAKFVLIGSWYKNPNLPAIEKYLEARGISLKELDP